MSSAEHAHCTNTASHQDDTRCRREADNVSDAARCQNIYIDRRRTQSRLNYHGAVDDDLMRRSVVVKLLLDASNSRVCLSWLRIRQLSCIVFEVFSRCPQFRCVRALTVQQTLICSNYFLFFFSNRLVKYHRFVIHAYTRRAMFRLQGGGAWTYSKELQGTVNECIRVNKK